MTHTVTGNDILVLGTDGLWDNLFDHDIVAILESRLDKSGTLHNLQDCSGLISTLAEVKSYDKLYESPFTVESRKAKDAKIELGGKEDDITVIVAQIK